MNENWLVQSDPEEQATPRESSSSCLKVTRQPEDWKTRWVGAAAFFRAQKAVELKAQD